MMKELARLRELIAALDRRAPRPEHPTEQRIAQQSAELKKAALERIAKISPLRLRECSEARVRERNTTGEAQ